jgi:acetyltransferase
MEIMIDYCRKRGTSRITGTALLENRGMLALAKQYGFSIHRNYAENAAEMELIL